MDINHVIDLSKITDNMNPYEFRLKKNKNFSARMLPLTKNNEQYLLIKQQEGDIHYYITAWGGHK